MQKIGKYQNGKTESESELNMTITANNQFLNASNIQECTNHRFMKFDHMLNLPRFQKLCYGAKMLYTYMLDRLHLSEKNSSRFSDERGLFIFFSYDEIMEKIGCAKAKAAGLLAELEEFGLIFRARCTGSARKKIYLPVVELTELEQAQVQVAEKQTAQPRETLLHEIADRYQWSESDVAAVIRKMFAGFEQTYGVGFTPEMVNQGTVPQSAEFDFQTQESSEIELPIEQDLPQQNLPFDDHSIDRATEKAEKSYEACLEQAEMQVFREKTAMCGLVSEPLEKGSDKARQELAAVMAWAYSTPKASLKISGVDVSVSTIRSKLKRITPHHITNILQNMQRSRKKIWNRKSYLLTCLFQAADLPNKNPIPISENAKAYESFVYNLN